MTAMEFIPELVLRDPAAGAAMLTQLFGFRAEAGGLLALGDQRIALAAGRPEGAGVLHHLALGVADTPAALREVLARGGTLERAETPDGPVLIPEFWEQGAEYVFIEGPEGARVELCARPGMARPGLPGHDHIGIACRDLAAMRQFFLSLGLTEALATILRRTTGDVAVSFLTTGRSTVELYRLPEPPARSAAPFWRRLLVPGLAAPLEGPEGVVLAPFTP